MSTMSVSRAARVALLHRHDFLDVLDVAAQLRQFRAGRIALGDEFAASSCR